MNLWLVLTMIKVSLSEKLWIPFFHSREERIVKIVLDLWCLRMKVHISVRQKNSHSFCWNLKVEVLAVCDYLASLHRIKVMIKKPAQMNMCTLRNNMSILNSTPLFIRLIGTIQWERRINWCSYQEVVCSENFLMSPLLKYVILS